MLFDLLIFRQAQLETKLKAITFKPSLTKVSALRNLGNLGSSVIPVVSTRYSVVVKNMNTLG